MDRAQMCNPSNVYQHSCSGAAGHHVWPYESELVLPQRFGFKPCTYKADFFASFSKWRITTEACTNETIQITFNTEPSRDTTNCNRLFYRFATD